MMNMMASLFPKGRSRASCAFWLVLWLLYCRIAPSQSWSFPNGVETRTTRQRRRRLLLFSNCNNENKEATEDHLAAPSAAAAPSVNSKDRRRFLQKFALLTVTTSSSVVTVGSFPLESQAGELGARITKAVTTSDLGISVRKSVVQGAQVMDRIDGQWEQFSDRLGLGAARAKQPGRPAPKVIPDPQPLNGALAARCLQICNQVFAAVAQMPQSVLQEQIEKVAEQVRPSFQRSGLELRPNGVLETGPQFNFASYVHFKAYSDLIIDRNIDFRKFKPQFEEKVGQQLASIFLSSSSSSSSDALSVKSAATATKDSTPEAQRAALGTAVERIDRLCAYLVAQGLVARIDLAPLDAVDVADWAQDLTDLTWSVALDGDVTLQSQILLQEQGFRLYPNFARYAVQSVLTQLLSPRQEVTAVDYYLDTDYNSDPDKFEVKEVLVNINIESR